MATRYRIQIGDEIIEFEGPDDLSDAQISQLGDQHLKTAKPGQEFPPSVYIGDVVDPALAEEPQGDSSALGSYGRGIVQGGTANFGDEISAFANAAIPGLAALDDLTGMGGVDQQAFYDNPEGFWAAVRHNMGESAAQKEADLAQHPTAHMLGEISGAIGTVPAASAAAARLPLALTEAAAARPILTATGLGGAAGAVSGAGAGVEGTRGQSAALGGLAGLALGGSIAGTMELAPAVANYAKIFFGRGNDKEAVSQITKALQRDGFDVTSPSGIQRLKDTLQQFTGKPVSLADIGGATRSRAGVGLRSPSGAQQNAIDTLENRTAGQGQRLAEDVRSNVAPRTDVHTLDEALVQQRSDEAARLREQALYEQAAPRGKVDIREFDDLDDEVDDLEKFYDVTYTTPDGQSIPLAMIKHPDGTATIDATESGVESNSVGVGLLRDAARQIKEKFPDIKAFKGERTSGSGAGRIQEIPAENFGSPTGRQSRIVDPTRESDPERYQTAVELQNLARLPDAQKALTAALKVTDAEKARLAATGADISHLPDLSRGSDLDVRAFDALKRYLDDEIGRIYKRGEGNSFKMADVANVRALRDDIRERLKKFVPEYGDYLDQYAGSSEMIDALREGANFRKLSPEQISAEQSRRSTAGQELYRTGAARDIVDDLLSKDRGFAADRISLSDEAKAQRLAMGVDPANADALNRSVQQERILNLLPRELSGAQTAQRQLAQADAGDFIPTNIANPYGFGGRFLQRIADTAALRRNEGVNQELLPRLMETDPKIIGGIIDELEANGQTQLAAELRRRQIQSRAGLLGGLTIGAPVALGE